ncbi:MAG: glycosyltransferase [Deltaproteobacteria bacterium]|nr:glycosyltransferase [Deltaproteobacteria bacterium]
MPGASLGCDMPGPEVTIAIPLYNGAETIGETLESVLAQSFGDTEVVVLDDGSTDGSLDVVACYDDPRLRVLRYENRGLAHNFNRCILEARGRFMKIVPQNDLLHPDHVAELAKLLRESPRPALAFCRRRVLYDECDPWSVEWVSIHAVLEEVLEPLKPLNDGAALLRRWCDAGMLHRNCIGEPIAALFSTALAREIGGFSSVVAQNLDFALWIRLMVRGDVGYSPRVLSTFRLHDGSASRRHASGSRRFWEDLVLFEEIARDKRVTATLPELQRMMGREQRKLLAQKWKRRLLPWQDHEPLGSHPGLPASGLARPADWHHRPHRQERADQFKNFA